MVGLGSRGLSSAPLLGELLASQICQDPMPFSVDTLNELHPRSIANDHDLQVIQVYDLKEFWKDNAIASRYHKLYLTENEQPYLLTRLNQSVPEGFTVETVFQKADLVLYKKATPN